MADFVGTGLSHVKGQEFPKLLELTIYAEFVAQVKKQGDKTCLVTCENGKKFSFAELLSRVDQVAQGLLRLDVSKGDRVGVWMPNCSEWLEMQLATAKLGSILVNVNPDFKLPELEYALNLVGCKILAMAPGNAHVNYIEIVQRLCPELASIREGPVSCGRLPSLKRVVLTGGKSQPGMLLYESLYGHGSGNQELAASCDEAINLQFTSGTTGKPKATTLTHKGLLNNTRFMGATMHLTDKDVVCVPVPLYHCFGSVMGNLMMVTMGSSLVYPAPKFDALLTLKAVTEHKCTALYGVPTMFIAMLDHPEFSKFRPTTLRTGIMAGALCPVDTMNRVISDMGAKDVCIGYGMTETSPLSWATRAGTPTELRCTTVGQILPHTECKVVNPDTSETLPCDTPGELWTAGYLVMKDYWGDEVGTKNSVVMQDGKKWMRTGDLAVITSQGFCQIVGRIKDMILRGGENIFPKEIEEVLIAIPGISNASVIGVPDPKFGEQVCAWVQFKDGLPAIGKDTKKVENDLREYLKDQVAYYKIPKYWFFVKEFPLTVTGKIRKVEMREISVKKLSLANKGPASKL